MNVPLVEGAHVRVEVPELVMLAGAMAQDRPVEGLLLAEKLTFALNPLIPVSVIVELPAWPTLTEIFVGLAVSEKSWIVNVTFAERDSAPLTPVTVTV